LPGLFLLLKSLLEALRRAFGFRRALLFGEQGRLGLLPVDRGSALLLLGHLFGHRLPFERRLHHECVAA